jgi:hypothetical protein
MTAPDSSDATPDGARFGRTWPDLLTRGFWLLLGGGIVLGLLWYGGDLAARVPLWVVVALFMSLLWVPYLIARAREGARLILVTDGPLSLREYRMGRHYPLRIAGEPLHLTSESGTGRLLLTAFDEESGAAEGTALVGATIFDLARDVAAFDRLGRAYAAHLRDERITVEMVGVEVERRVRDHSDGWLRLLYGSMTFGELSDLLDSPPDVPDFDDLAGSEPDAADLPEGAVEP